MVPPTLLELDSNRFSASTSPVMRNPEVRMMVARKANGVAP